MSGRLSGHLPVRWLIGPGLLLVGVGLLLMSGINGHTTWTHLIPGFIVAGFGAGMVNPPLASTAIGVVQPARSGMASGVNSTFRQVGLAMSIAVQGSLFASALQNGLNKALASNPALAAQARQIATSVRQGSAAQVIASTPAASRGQLVAAIKSSFATGVNDLLIFTAVIALVGAVGAVVLIRSKDFVPAHASAPAPEPVPAS